MTLYFDFSILDVISGLFGGSYKNSHLLSQKSFVSDNIIQVIWIPNIMKKNICLTSSLLHSYK
jgi:hypothetical protein